MNYKVHCPSTGETEYCPSADHANDVAFDMHTDTDAYVWVEDYLGYTILEYGNA